jgi:hypothetical protein
VDWSFVFGTILGAAIALFGTVYVEFRRAKSERERDVVATYDRFFQMLASDFLEEPEGTAQHRAVQAWDSRVSLAQLVLVAHGAPEDVIRLAGDYRAEVRKWWHHKWSAENQDQVNAVMADLRTAVALHLSTTRTGWISRHLRFRAKAARL